jgi:diguanylate cyclase (GGDEF)-like protein
MKGKPLLKSEHTEPLPKLLVVDDEKHIRSSIKRAFIDDYQIIEASSGEEALILLKRGLNAKILLVDMFMPGNINGIDLFIEAKKIAPNSKRVLMTGKADLNLVFSAINKGSIDYFIKKPWDISEMAAVFSQMNLMGKLQRDNELLLLELKYSNNNLLKSNKDLKEHKELLLQSLDDRSKELLNTVRELENANHELKKKAVRDGLTGLYNHVTIKTRLDEEIARSCRYKSELSLIFMDIDHFKSYNDRLGHDTGDVVLTTLAHFLLNGSDVVSPSRKSDIVGRYGGEEFIIILPETSKEGALVRGERLRQGIEHLTVPGAKGQPLGCLSCSMGVATYPQDAKQRDKLLKVADEALYRAKSSGRNRVNPAIPNHEE